MSNKVKKAGHIKGRKVVSEWGLLASAMEYVLAATLIVMCVAVSFYAKEGYNQIGNAKFTAYRMVLTIGFFLFLTLGAAYLVFFFKTKKGMEAVSHGLLRISLSVFCDDSRVFRRFL